MPNAITLDEIRAILPLRPAEGHKGTFGHVLVIAGSQRYLGAARLSAAAASRSGVGLVSLCVPGGIAPAIAAQSLETMTLGLGDALTLTPACVDEALARAASMSAVALGPGITGEKNARDFVHAFVPRCPVPMVIDADGLNAVAHDLATLQKRCAPAVLTPHPGEMARLTGKSTAKIEEDRAGIAMDFAREYDCVVVLKGARTVIASAGEEVSVNATGNSGLATGGTGDVLTGLLGGLLAQGMAPFDAARIAVYAHGLAADLAAAELTERGMIASDVVAFLPKAWRVIERGNSE